MQPASIISENKFDTTPDVTEDLILAPRANADPSTTGGWPRITLITPVLNAARYMEQTIRSVLAQDYPNLEYGIVDGGSTDGTVEIIRRYEKWITWWVSEPDQGMYDAINKGFARTSGEIMGWISGTDQLHLGALRVVGSVFRSFPHVEWITGRPTILNEEGMTTHILDVARWSRIRFLAGANHCIQQESTFWRRSLWERAGGYVDASRRNASDFELWVRFFRHAALYSVNALIGGFRWHSDSLGLQDPGACDRVHREVLQAERCAPQLSKRSKMLSEFCRLMQRVPGTRLAYWQVVLQCLYKWRGPDWPPVVFFDRATGGWVMRNQLRDYSTKCDDETWRLWT
jgi:hypothetical protein